MRKLLPLLLTALLAGVTLGQDGKSDDAKAEFLNPKYWSKLGPTTEGQRGFTLFSRNILPNPEGQYELWIKVVPANVEAFNKQYSLPQDAAYVLQYATVDCEKRLLLLEKTGVYDAKDMRLNAGSNALTPKSAKDRVKPGSIGAIFFEYFCQRM